MSALVERQFSFALTNEGNGQDTFTIELYEWCPGGLVGDPDVHVDAEQGQRTQRSPSLLLPVIQKTTLTSTSRFINSQDESVDGQVKVTIKKAAIVLTIDEGRIATEWTNR